MLGGNPGGNNTGGVGGGGNSACHYVNSVLAGGSGGNGGGEPSGDASRTRPKEQRTRGDASDGWGALERDLERVGVQAAVGSSYAAFGRQNWEFKRVNQDYTLVPTYPQVRG